MRLERSQLLRKGSTVLPCWPTNLNASNSDVIREKAFTGPYLCLITKNKFQQTASWKCCDINLQWEMCFLDYLTKISVFSKHCIIVWRKKILQYCLFHCLFYHRGAHQSGRRTSYQNWNPFSGTYTFWKAEERNGTILMHWCHFLTIKKKKKKQTLNAWNEEMKPKIQNAVMRVRLNVCPHHLWFLLYHIASHWALW